MKYKFIAIFMIVLSAGMLRAQSVNFRFSTYVYGWQRIDSLSDETTAKTTHMRGYQNLLLDVNGTKWSFNTLAQTEEDLTSKVGTDGFHYRLYNAYVKGTGLFNNMLDVKLGRQYIFAGVGKGTVDGLYLKGKFGKNKEYQLSLYGGALAPYTYDFKDYPSVKYNFTLGGQFAYYGVKDLMVALSYTNKHQQPVSYIGTRLDSLYNTTERVISFDPQSNMLAGLDARYSYMNKYDFFAKAYVDVIRKRFYKGEFNVSAIVLKNTGGKTGGVLRISADYLYSEPQIALNSIFWVFEHKKTQEIQGGLNYTMNCGINVFAKGGVVLYQKTETPANVPKNTSFRIEGGIAHPMYGLTFVKYLGYAGSSDGVNAYYNREIFKSKFTVTSAVSYSSYRIGDYTTSSAVVTEDKVNSFSGVLGINYRPMPQFSIDAQGQMMINRIYKTDARFLIGFNYWMFKKL